LRHCWLFPQFFLNFDIASSAARRSDMLENKIVSDAEWLQARTEFLKLEKEFIKRDDEFKDLRRKLPWRKVQKNYQFEGCSGNLQLKDLFLKHSQLIIYHFMLAPEWEEGCKGCSFVADNFDGAIDHLQARDVSLVAVSRAPMDKINRFKQRMNWNFPWVSSQKSEFNFDFEVSFTEEALKAGKVRYNYREESMTDSERPGLSVFYKNTDEEIFHTYSTYARGLDALIGTYRYLDLTPKGRNEGGLPYAMAWVKHHDKYRSEEKKENCCHDH
jgi:predicted dithiol-disulfide oxidoreductase (DUF899 family)